VTRHAKRTDENHAELRDGLRALGHEVFDFSHVGGGVADLAVKATPTMSLWLEVKKDKKEKLTDKEVIFKMLFFDCYRVVVTIDDAVNAIEQFKLEGMCK
jgi:hypothetical protein